MDPRMTLSPNNRITTIEMHSHGTTNWNADYASFYKDIEVNIALIQNSCDHLDKQLRLIGTPKDVAELRSRILIIYQKTNNRIRNTGENIEGLHTVFSTGDLQQKIKMDEIKRNYFNVIKHYVSVQKHIVLAARQSDKLFWDTYTETDHPNGMETIVRESFESMSDQWQRKGDCLLQKRQDILRLMELEILDINEIIINLVSGLVNDHTWQLDSVENNIGDSTNCLEAESKDIDSKKQQYCHKTGRIILSLILMICLIVLFIVMVVLLPVE